MNPFSGKDVDALKWYQQAELQNGRWAMMGAAGILGENLLGVTGIGGPAAKVPWYEAGAYTYFAPASTLFIVQLFLFGWVEARRYQDYRNPGSASQDPIFTNNKLPAGEVGYPGGIFDPLNFAKGNLAELKVKELKNARLAMLGCLGFFVQVRRMSEERERETGSRVPGHLKGVSFSTRAAGRANNTWQTLTVAKETSSPLLNFNLNLDLLLALARKEKVERERRARATAAGGAANPRTSHAHPSPPLPPRPGPDHGQAAAN